MNKLKYNCVSCGEQMKNSEELHNRKGNYCSSCNVKVDRKIQWRTLKNNIHNLEEKLTTTKDIKKITRINNQIATKQEQLNKLDAYIQKRWQIDMRQDMIHYLQFKDIVDNLLNV